MLPFHSVEPDLCLFFVFMYITIFGHLLGTVFEKILQDLISGLRCFFPPSDRISVFHCEAPEGTSSPGPRRVFGSGPLPYQVIFSMSMRLFYQESSHW